ncbi:dTDP-4-dehydrorhamnose 3,5-epimerase [Bacillus timonensis]|nr:dTDP-4-dehydrorhamnose 3,5-epimerase [Bacillus timonensis]
MQVIETKLEGLKIIEPQVHNDNRGYFIESYNKNEWKEHGIDIDFIQDNQSFSRPKGVIRGLHYQDEPFAQTKLVRVLVGEIFDVAVDLRRNSKTFGQWVSVYLNDCNQRQLLIPKGFAHGFCTTVENTHVLYKVDNSYSRKHEKGIIWNDSILKIDWPVNTPILSEKDNLLPTFDEIVDKTKQGV